MVGWLVSVVWIWLRISSCVVIVIFINCVVSVLVGWGGFAMLSTWIGEVVVCVGVVASD